MPRDNLGVYTPPFNWVNDSAARQPFSPERWQEQDEDFADALNDLPLASIVPTWCEPGTDAATVNPGSLMELNGKTYVRTSVPIWKQIGPGITDITGIVAVAVAEIRAGVAENLDTFPEIIAKIEEQLTSVEAGSLYAPMSHAHAFADLTSKPTTLAGYGITDAAASSHTHAIANVTGLQGALDAKSATGHAHAIADTTGLQAAIDGKQALIGYTESGTAPATPAVRDQWRNSTTGALYQRVQNGSDPIWQQIG